MTTTCYESWRRLFREVLEAGIDVHQIVAGWTPLLTLLGSQISEQWTWTYPSSRCKDDWNRALREWLADLKAAGIDLNQFGWREDSILKSGMVERDLKWRRSRDHFVRLIGFRYGPFPDDWSIWCSEPTDEFAGEFWAMTERRYEMPGSWPMETNIIL